MRSAVDQYEAPLTQYVTRLVRGDVERARDVVQDAFVRLWSVDRASVEGHLGQWLYRVCRNRALDVRRKESRMTALQDDQLDVMAGQPGAPRSSHEGDDAAAESTHGTEVISLLDSLNETQQEALRLKFQGNLSYKEIATVMDITSNHVGVLIHNAIKALRERMSAAANGPDHAAHVAATSARGGRT